MSEIGHNDYSVTASELRQLVERVERTDAEIKDLQDVKKEIYAEAKGRGYNVPILKKLIQRRRRDPQDISEEEAVLELYEEALDGSGDPLDD